LRPRDPRGVALGLDLGSTAIKAGLLGAEGRLLRVAAVPAPPLRGSGNVREGDAQAYADAALGLLRDIAEDVAPGTPLGLASQRSSFTIWSRDDGRPRTPLISWQDRRAAGWCAAHRSLAAEVTRRTGLPLSAHYAGPKLAAIRSDPDLALELRGADRLFGTLDAFVAWQWSGGACHETDVTVAARTLMLDLEREDWEPGLLRAFDVPRSILPRVVRSSGRAVPLQSGLRLAASLADQAAGALAAFDEADRTALVNLGTGAFVLLPTRERGAPRPGYLLAPILAAPGAPTRYALEGTINGAGPALDRFGCGPTRLPGSDPHPDAFAIPDLSGLGSPHWLPERGLTLSAAAAPLPDADRRRVVLEGLLFRVREILEDLCQTGLPERIVVSGGLIRDPGVGAGLAALLARRVELSMERESGLVGCCRLAAGLPPRAGGRTRSVDPGPAGGYLPAKYERWCAWYAEERRR
jgi:glycerol kinase